MPDNQEYLDKISTLINLSYVPIELEDLPEIEANIISFVNDFISNSNGEIYLDNIPNNSKIVVFGDIHCDRNALTGVFKKLYYSDFPYFEKAYFIFLGDYVDRGALPIETIRLLLYLKKLLAERFILLKGNHDDFRYDETKEVFYSPVNPSETIGYFQKYFRKETIFKIKEFFDCLPYFALCNKSENRFMFVHGGIPKDGYLQEFNLENLSKMVNRDIRQNNPVYRMLNSLTWGNPVNVPYKQNDNGSFFEFGEQQFNEFSVLSNIDKIIRGHEVISSGYRIDFKGSVHTVSTSGGINNDKSYFEDIVPYPVFLIINENGAIVPENVFTYKLNIFNDSSDTEICKYYYIENAGYYNIVIRHHEYQDEIGVEITDDKYKTFFLNDEFALNPGNNKIAEEFLKEYFPKEATKLLK